MPSTIAVVLVLLMPTFVLADEMPPDTPPAPQPEEAQTPLAPPQPQPEASRSPTLAPEPTPEPAAAAAAAWYDQVTLGGLVDVFFSLPVRSDDTGLRDPSFMRAFDASNGTFQLAYAELNLAMAAKPVGFRIDLGFGQVADLTNLQTVDLGMGMTINVPNETYKHIQQAYVSFQVPGVDALVVDVGRFVTTAGAEVIEAKDNWMYSRSILFGFAIPYSHTGVRASFAVSSELTLQASLVNGWDVVEDNNVDKTVGLSVTWAHADTAAILTYYGGTEATDFRNLVDLAVTQKVDERLTLNLNADYGKEGNASWYGVAAMGRYQVSRQLRLALRAEYFGDPDGTRTSRMPPDADLSVTEITANFGLPLGDHVELKLEGRVDIASKDVFGTPADKTQPTVQFAALAWF